MAEEKLTIVTNVRGAAQVVTDVGKIEGALDRVATKAGSLRSKISGLGGGLVGNIAAGLRDQVATEVIYRAPAMVKETFDRVNAETAASTADVAAKANKQLADKPTLDQINQSIAAIDTGIKKIQDNPFTALVGGVDSARQLKELKDKYEAQRQTLVQEGADTERALRSNANAIVAAINGLDLNVTVFSQVKANVTFQDVVDRQTTADRYTGGAPAPTYSH